MNYPLTAAIVLALTFLILWFVLKPVLSPDIEPSPDNETGENRNLHTTDESTS